MRWPTALVCEAELCARLVDSHRCEANRIGDYVSGEVKRQNLIGDAESELIDTDSGVSQRYNQSNPRDIAAVKSGILVGLIDQAEFHELVDLR